MKMSAGAAVLQKLYEDGASSYPRSDNDALSDASVEVLAHVAERHRIPFDGSAIPRFTPSAAHPHEGVHPTVEGAATIDLTIPTRMLSPADRVLQCITRSWLRQGSDLGVEIAATAHLPPWAQSIPWTRPTAQTPAALLFDGERHPERSLTIYPLGAVALRLLSDEGLGRPSTLAAHADHLAERGMFDANGLTIKGRQALQHAPTALASPEVSRRVEAIVDGRDVTTGVEAISPQSRGNGLLMLVGRVIEGALPEMKPRFAQAMQKAVDADGTSSASSSRVSAREDEADLTPMPMPMGFRWPWCEMETDADAERALREQRQLEREQRETMEREAHWRDEADQLKGAIRLDDMSARSDRALGDVDMAASGGRNARTSLLR